MAVETEVEASTGNVMMGTVNLYHFGYDMYHKCHWSKREKVSMVQVKPKGLRGLGPVGSASHKPRLDRWIKHNPNSLL